MIHFDVASREAILIDDVAFTTRLVSGPHKSGDEVQHFDFYYRAGSWKKRRRWWVHVASSFPLAHQYREVLGTG